jgi:SAM-dependent methyltransferase
MLVFDRSILRLRRERAAHHWHERAYLKRELAERLVERLGDVRRQFPLALDLGCHGGEIAQALAAVGPGAGGIAMLVQSDLAEGFARHAATRAPAVVADEEFLPFAAGAFNLVLSAMALHWVNDLPGTLVQIRRVLQPDGLFLGVLLGGETLWQLRSALATAESEVSGGLSPRVSPFADLRDGAALLQRAGFALPVADSERIEVRYSDALSLMKDLAAMGESNLVRERLPRFSGRAVLLRGAEIYAARHGGADGRVAATFEPIFLHGWAPHESQQQPLRPGSARLRLADALGTVERSAGEKTGRAR